MVFPCGEALPSRGHVSSSPVILSQDLAWVCLFWGGGGLARYRLGLFSVLRAFSIELSSLGRRAGALSLDNTIFPSCQIHVTGDFVAAAPLYF